MSKEDLAALISEERSLRLRYGPGNLLEITLSEAQWDAIEAALKDAARWQAGKRLGFPQFCDHDDSQPSGTCWYVELKQSNDSFQSSDEAMDAAMAEAMEGVGMDGTSEKPTAFESQRPPPEGPSGHQPPPDDIGPYPGNGEAVAGTYREEAVDARRYRWLRERPSFVNWDCWEPSVPRDVLITPEFMDKAVDAAMKR